MHSAFKLDLTCNVNIIMLAICRSCLNKTVFQERLDFYFIS